MVGRKCSPLNLSKTLFFGNRKTKQGTEAATLGSQVLERVQDYRCIKICKSMILPFFDYEDIIYMEDSNTLLAKLQRLQNKALKICLNIENRHPTSNLHK